MTKGQHRIFYSILSSALAAAVLFCGWQAVRLLPLPQNRQNPQKLRSLPL